MFVLENTTCLSIFVKRFFTIRWKIYTVYMSMLFKKYVAYFWKDKLICYAPLKRSSFDLLFGL